MGIRQENPQHPPAGLGTLKAGAGVRKAHQVDGIPHVQFALLLVLILLVLHVDVYVASGAQLLMLRGEIQRARLPGDPGVDV